MCNVYMMMVRWMCNDMMMVRWMCNDGTVDV